jgi:2',3'-cyclic-nucleotide 2'-phosphodiesterase (5'-nucleotidase family)
MPRFATLASIALVLLLALAPPGRAWADCVEGQGLILLHFNDFHGQIETYTDPESETPTQIAGIARLAAAVGQVRAQARAGPWCCCSQAICSRGR